MSDKPAKQSQAGQYKRQANYKALNIPMPNPLQRYDPIIPRNEGYRTLDGRVFGDPPIGRSALDQRTQA